MTLKFIPFVLLILFTSCNQETSANQTDKKEDTIQSFDNFIKTFEGKINDKYPIIAKIESNEGQLSGHYYYKNKGQELELQGTIDYDGNLQLKEFDGQNNQTGVFNGTISDGKMKGQWSKPNGKNSAEFYLLDSNTDYQSFKKSIPKQILIDGAYKGEHGEVTIIKSSGSDHSYKFTIISTNRGGCTGIITGYVVINSNNEGVFSDKTCENLSFYFSEKKLRITEKGCTQNHGLTCDFEDIYKKIAIVEFE